jgi:uncharacterized glyoxalase superfamily protein PhnB
MSQYVPLVLSADWTKFFSINRSLRCGIGQFSPCYRHKSILSFINVIFSGGNKMSYHLTNCVPMLETNDLSETISFYSKNLGFKCIGMYPSEQHPLWANLKRENVEIMFSIRNTMHRETTEEVNPVMTGSLYLYPDDLDSVWNQVKDNVTVEYPIETFDYGMREFAIRDCNGYLIQIGKPIESD